MPGFSLCDVVEVDLDVAVACKLRVLSLVDGRLLQAVERVDGEESGRGCK